MQSKARRRTTIDIIARVQLLTTTPCLVDPVIAKLRKAGFYGPEIRKTSTTTYMEFQLRVRPEAKR